MIPRPSTPEEDATLPLADEWLEPCHQCRAVFPPAVEFFGFFRLTGYCSPACEIKHLTYADPKRAAEPRKGME